MANIVYWAQLPTKIKEKIESLQPTLSCIDVADVDAAVADLTWFRLPEKVETLISVLNANLSGADYDPGKKLNFFSLESEVAKLFDYLDTATCV